MTSTTAEGSLRTSDQQGPNMAAPADSAAGVAVLKAVEGAANGAMGRLLNEGVALLLATGGSYVVAYAYEYRFASYYGIPIDFIYISMQNVLLAFISILGLAGFALHWFRNVVILSGMGPIARSHGIAITLIRRHFIEIVIAVAVLTMTRFDPGFYLLALGLVPLPLYTEMLMPPLLLMDPEIRRAAGVKGFHAYMRFWTGCLETPSPPEGVLESGKLTWVYIVFLSIMVPVFVAGFLGHGEARRKVVFPFLGESDEAILRRYGDMLVIGRFDRESGQLAGEYRTMKVEDFREPVVLKRIAPYWLAPVSVNETMKLESRAPTNDPAPGRTSAEASDPTHETGPQARPKFEDSDPIIGQHCAG